MIVQNEYLCVIEYNIRHLSGLVNPHYDDFLCITPATFLPPER